MKYSISHRKVLVMLFDIAVLLVASAFSAYWVHKFFPVSISTPATVRTALLFAALGFIAIYVGGEYKKAWKLISKRDYFSCIFEAFIATVLTGVVLHFWDIGDYGTINTAFFVFLASSFLIAATGIVGIRHFAKRYFVFLVNAGQEDVMKKALVVGAGNAGKILALEISNAFKSGRKDFYYSLIGFVDDDPNKINEKINGYYVIGTSFDIKEICKKYGVEVIFFAIPSCPSEKKAEILEACAETNCEVKVVPEISRLISGKSILNQTTKVNVEDLLGREPVTLDTTALAAYIAGKTCMVTGGGGSIGSELCRQIMHYQPRKLVIVDIYENNAYDIQQELIMNGIANADNLKVLIASVRDKEKMEAIFQEYKPDLVFHAAAHKHVPLMEVSPEEAVKNNVFGTYNVAELSDKYHVKRFVLVSTDKAVNPTNVMGATKRYCEMIVQNFSHSKKNTEYVAVRFGNVLGSNGSVIPLFKKQIESGKPVTITHPDIIRYFMTIPEAVSLILTAGSMAHGGEIFVLDMGKPVKILTLAENLIKVYGKKPYEDVEIIFTGLRPGEKLYEELLMSEEGLQQTANKKVFIGTQLDIDDKTLEEGLQALKAVSEANDSKGVADVLEQYVPTFHHKTNQ
ncbi:MAG: polysaccharide biosynthesis protein [Clostridia bacterium]|nr:polysaccharide biosynthesis protein [Clostridia bacterium]